MRDDMFMITCEARTGSTMLCIYLNSHPDVLMHGEIYSPARTTGLRGRFAAQIGDEEANARLTTFCDVNQTAFLYKYVYEPQGHARVGHKLKYDELVRPEWRETLEAVRRDTDIRIIHLYRRNLFARFVSWWMVHRVTQVTMIKTGQKPPEFRRSVIPVEECERNFVRTQERYARFSEVFRHHRRYEVVYEDLIGPCRDETLTGVQSFLGLPVVPLRMDLEKITPADLRSIVENYDEIADHFHGTVHAGYFEDAAV